MEETKQTPVVSKVSPDKALYQSEMRVDYYQEQPEMYVPVKFNLMDFTNILPFMNKQVANVADKIQKLWNVVG